MTVYNLTQGTRTSSLLTAGTLAAATYITGSAIDLSADVPLSITFEVEGNANGTPSGNKQLILFLKWSLDNTNWQTGPESGTTATEEPDLDWGGALPMNDTNDHRKFFTIYPKARYVKPILKNDLGVALTSGAVYRADWTGEST
jgi:hypothetical protein